MVKILKSKNKQYYYVVIAKNGKVLVSSETMKTKKSCYKGIESLKKLCGKAVVVMEDF